MAQQKPIYSWEHLSPFKLLPCQSTEWDVKLTPQSANISEWPVTTVIQEAVLAAKLEKRIRTLGMTFYCDTSLLPPIMFNDE